MKNLKEVQPILTALFCLNRVSDHEDKDITTILDYAFRRIIGANTNLLSLACIGKTKEQVLPDVTRLLEEDTEYKNYLEDYKK